MTGNSTFLTLAAAAASLVPAAASAAAPGATKGAGPSLSVAAEHSSYNRGYGTKSLATVSARVPLSPDVSLSLALGRGERRSAGHSITGSNLSATFLFRLNDHFGSRTILARGDAGPLFAGRVFGQELGYKWKETELRGAARLSRYEGGIDVGSVHAGVSQALGRFRLDYGVTAYWPRGIMPSGVIHRADLALDDDHGSTRLELGAGSSLHEHDWRPSKVRGSFRSVGVKRKQRLGGGIALELGGGWTAFDRPAGRYGAAKVGAALTLSR